jgi:hypothetical protein
MAMSQRNDREKVVCICGGFGFPRGAGSPARITVVGKALQAAGMDFELLHTGPSPTPLNTERSGIYEGIPFRYTTTIHRPQNVVLRGLVYLVALINTTIALLRLRADRKRTVIWLYYIGGVANLYLNHLCHLLGLHTVQELCEWWPGEPTCSRFVRWQHRRQLFVNLSGVLVISKLVEERTVEICESANPGVRVHRLPSTRTVSCPRRPWFPTASISSGAAGKAGSVTSATSSRQRPWFARRAMTPAFASWGTLVRGPARTCCSTLPDWACPKARWI